MHITGAEFVKLLTEYHDDFFNYIVRYVPCFHAAEDVMQETTSAMWEMRQNFTPGTNFVAWGHRIAYYRIMEYRNKRKRDHKIIFNDETLKIIGQSMPAQESRDMSYIQKLKECLAKLQAKDLNIVRLRYWQNIRVPDISTRLNMSIRNVYYHLARVERSLLICIERDNA